MATTDSTRARRQDWHVLMYELLRVRIRWGLVERFRFHFRMENVIEVGDERTTPRRDPTSIYILEEKFLKSFLYFL